MTARERSSDRLDDHRRAVAEDFGGAHFGGDFAGVESQADDGVGAHLSRVIDHEVVGLLAGLLAHFGVGADLAADEGFEAAEDSLGDGGGADDDASDDAEVLADAVAFNGERSSDRNARM